MNQGTAYSHRRDFGHVLELEQFQSVAKVGNETKPIAMIFTDGGPDENRRFSKTPDVSIQHFKKHKFDDFLYLPMLQVCQPTIKWNEKWHL